MSALFPLFLKLQGRKCLLVGGGCIAEQKLHSLLASGAVVTVVAPEVSDGLRSHIVNNDVSWQQRKFAPSDVHGSVLVIAATGDPAVNEQVFRAADEIGALCNAVDEPERCHFYYGSVMRRGDLQIAISTNGKSPALAQRIRKELEERYDESYADWLRWLGEVRDLYFRTRVAAERRVRALHQIASLRVYQKFRTARRHRAEAQHG